MTSRAGGTRWNAFQHTYAYEKMTKEAPWRNSRAHSGADRVPSRSTYSDQLGPAAPRHATCVAECGRKPGTTPHMLPQARLHRGLGGGSVSHPAPPAEPSLPTPTAARLPVPLDDTVMAAAPVRHRRHGHPAAVHALLQVSARHRPPVRLMRVCRRHGQRHRAGPLAARISALPCTPNSAAGCRAAGHKHHRRAPLPLRPPGRRVARRGLPRGRRHGFCRACNARREG
jgi:hypothetical protein